MEMDQLVALCKRRGFLFQSSEIYGGLNGFWDYGPMGVELKRNVREAWWRDMVTSHNELIVADGAPSTYEMAGLDCTIIMHPQVWKCSGHYDLFHDYMVDCRETKRRYRYDQVTGRWAEAKGRRVFVTSAQSGHEADEEIHARAMKFFKLRPKQADQLTLDGEVWCLTDMNGFDDVLGPDAKHVGTLTEPREFNLMFKTFIGALGGEESAAFLRPETAQGIFVNFKNVLDSTRVKLPFGIAQIGKSFRTKSPRGISRSARGNSNRWRSSSSAGRRRLPSGTPTGAIAGTDGTPTWAWRAIVCGSAITNKDELSHYSCGTADIEYAFPFLAEGEFGELEGVAHRGDFDLRSHMEGKLVREGDELKLELDENGKPRHRGSGRDLQYYDDQTKERFTPHVIEPSAGADRATLAFLCEAYQVDQVPDEKGNPSERVFMKFDPRLAPMKAAVFPLVKKDGMPEVAKDIFGDLKQYFNVFYDEKGAVGRRYRRQDEIGTPFCVTVDGETMKDGTVTIRDRDTLEQWRVHKKEVAGELKERLGL